MTTGHDVTTRSGTEDEVSQGSVSQWGCVWQRHGLHQPSPTGGRDRDRDSDRDRNRDRDLVRDRDRDRDRKGDPPAKNSGNTNDLSDVTPKRDSKKRKLWTRSLLGATSGDDTERCPTSTALRRTLTTMTTTTMTYSRGGVACGVSCHGQNAAAGEEVERQSDDERESATDAEVYEDNMD